MRRSLCWSRSLPATSMLFTVLKKGADLRAGGGFHEPAQRLYRPVFPGTGGLHAHRAPIPTPSLTIPVESRAVVYQYYDGGLIQFAMPVIPALILAGLMAAAFAFLIGLPVLRLKSDYLAIATLGFAEIIRAIFQWDKLGAVTNGSNMLRLSPPLTISTSETLKEKSRSTCPPLIPFLIAGVCIAPDRAADPFQLRPRLQGHPGRRGRRRGHGHQSGPAQAAWPSASAPSSRA